MSTAAESTACSNHLAPLIDEYKWIIQIRDTIKEELEEGDDICVSIFNTPKPLLQFKPEAFVPQLLAIGPYHHWRPELYEMEKYKLSSAKRIQKQLPGVKFQQLVDLIAEHEHSIRGNYHRHLDFQWETLAWMMAVDACFLLEFLQVYTVVEQGKALKRVSSRMSHLVDNTFRTSGHNTVLRDIMMMENQIPLFVLRLILDLQFPSSPSAGDEAFLRILIGFMKEVCRFKAMGNFPPIDVSEHFHLLELLYYILVPRSVEKHPTAREIVEHPVEYPAAADVEEGLAGDSSHVKRLCCNVWTIASRINGGPIRFLKRAVLSRPVKFLVKVPWKLTTVIPCIAAVSGPIDNFFSSQMVDGGSKPGGDHDKPPLVEEIMIPSVEELKDSGVRFCPTNGDLTSIAFDVKTAIFYFPTISLDVNAEVVLRNLVAYEASVAPGPLVFTRFTELINGIIDTEEDVKLLRDDGIVLNQLKSDKEVAELCNGMSKSVRLTKVAFIDKVIEDVNKYHSSRWSVKTKKFVKKYIFGSWAFLTFLAAVLLLLLTTLQAFCSVYSCARRFNISNFASDGQ